MVFKKKIEPFTKSSDNDLKMKENEEIPGKICEIVYLIGYIVDAKFKFDIKFPSFEKQKKMTKADDDIILNSYNQCRKDLKPYPLEKKTSIEIALILKKHNITNFVDPDYYPILKEVEVDAREYFSL